ncbi:MAG TPA: site-2 protease family protein [Methanocella sp.]|nr:site-2 protease family protein [Methanocella sp.]
MLDSVWLLVLLGFAFWWTIVFMLDRAGVLKRFNTTSIGPLIMWRTYRGQKFLDMLASPKEFWKMLITACIPMVFFSMFLMLLMMVILDAAMIVNTPSPGPANAPQNILAIPGVNQFIPFVWGWIALIVAMVVHEFGHAISAKAENIKVKSLGLLLIPIPIGAFAEIDEEEMFGTKTEGGAAEILGPMDTKAAGAGGRKATSMAQVRILSAGVISNFLIGILAFALLFGPVLGAVAATNSEMIVVDVAPNTAASQAGIQKNMQIKTVDNISVKTPDQFNAYLKSRQGSSVIIGGLQGDRPVSYTVQASALNGVYILGTLDSHPAAKAGIAPGMQLVSINSTPIKDNNGYMTFMANTTPGQTVSVGLIAKNGTSLTVPVTLESGTEPKGYMGFGGADLSDNSIGVIVGSFDARNHLSNLQNILSFQGDTLKDKLLNLIGGILTILFLPIWEVTGGVYGFNVFQSDLTSLFHPVGWAAPLGNVIFYIILSLFWIGWLNIMVGLFNCMPMIPLDGGHIFREVTRMTVGKIVHDTAKVDHISRAIVNGFAITLFASLVFVIVAPYIVHGIG